MRRKKYYNTKENKRVNKIALFIIFIIVCVLIFFLYKKIKSGNNIDRTSQGISNYILNISSYKATVTVTVESNKNKNRYRLVQQYTKENDIYKQELQEPENIKGLTIVYDGDNLKIENTKLNLNEIYEKYEYVSNNALCLYSFVEDYLNSQNTSIKETDSQVIMSTKTKNESNKYMMYKTLYINKQTLKPEKLEIKDINKNVLVYIEYNEIEINSTNKEEILAFNINNLEI